MNKPINEIYENMYKQLNETKKQFKTWEWKLSQWRKPKQMSISGIEDETEEMNN